MPLLLPLVACLLLLLLFLLVEVVWRGCHWQRLGVKGPRGWPLFGNMAQFALGWRSYGEVYADLYEQHPGQRYVGFYRLFNEPALLVRDQELLRQILVGGHFADCADNAVHVDHRRRDVLASYNPFLARGDRWRLLRSDLVPLFTPSRLRQILPHVSNACGLLREQPPRGPCFEAKEWATRYTLQVVASAVFGLDAHCVFCEKKPTDNPWLQLLAPLFQPSAWSLLETVALLHSPLLGKVLRYRYVPLPVQHWLRALVDARSQETNNLLHWLAAEGKRSLDRVELAGHATTLVLEGYETSALLLAFALYELARNKDIQRRLHTELDEVAGRGQHDYHMLGKLHYTEAVLLETLRLHPAMQALQKRCTQSFSLPGGPCVQKGTVLVLPVQAIHLDPQLHPEPESFRPERFLDQTPMGCRFLGFGAGPRMCPGQRFGLLQTKAALATLLQEHRVLEGTKGAVKVSPLTFLTASKGGIWLRLERRSQGEKTCS